MASLSMVATGGEKKASGAKINVKKGDFDITAPTKRVGDEDVKVKKIIPAPPLVSEIGTPSQKVLCMVTSCSKCIRALTLRKRRRLRAAAPGAAK